MDAECSGGFENASIKRVVSLQLGFTLWMKKGLKSNRCSSLVNDSVCFVRLPQSTILVVDYFVD